jgi:predicted Zn-dependent protease
MRAAQFIKFSILTTVLILITINSATQSYRQQLAGKGIRLPDAATLRQQIYDREPPEYKTGIYKDMTYYHAAIMVNMLTENLYSGNYYTEWPELEEYLYHIFKLIAPPELVNDTLFRIIIQKEGNFNAFMTPSGLMSINVGLFDNLQDESTLAGIMAHELSHFMLHHSLRTYISYRTGEFDSFLSVDEDILNRFNSKLEYQADSMAVTLLSKSPYSLKGLIQAFDLMALVDRHRNALSSGDIDFDKTTHPSSENRKERLLGYCRKYDMNKGSKFAVDAEMFYKTRKRAKQEILMCLMEEFSFDECTEKAFKYHVLEPANHFYIRYIAESIRRNCYGNLKQWDKLFITYRYFDTLVNDKFRPPIPISENQALSQMCS